MLLGSWLQQGLDSIEERNQKLLAITLDSHVGRLPVLLVSKDEINCVVSISLSHLEEAKESLELH